MVLFVDLDLALRGLELLTRQAFEDESVGIGANLLDRLGEEEGLEIGCFHNRVRDRILAVLPLEVADKALVLRRLRALEVVERGIVAKSVLRAHRLDFLLRRDRRADRNVLRGYAELTVLLVKRHDLVANQVGENDIAAAGSDLVDVGRELGVAQRRVLFRHVRAAVLLQQRLDLAVGFLRIDVVGAN